MAICCRNTCAVIRACDKVCIGKLTHSGSITSAGFVPNNPNHLITIDNRTFKLWDVKDGLAVTESSTMISSFTCLSVHSHYIALGSANGKIRLYSIGSNQSACELDVKSLVKQQSQDDSSVDKEAGCVDIMLYSTFNGSDDATPSCLH
jgi:WD40 repeat protein